MDKKLIGNENNRYIYSNIIYQKLWKQTPLFLNSGVCIVDELEYIVILVLSLSCNYSYKNS